MKSELKQLLINKAKEASLLSYSPYSKFRVGAALLTKELKIYSGTNIENRSYGLTNCAERVAIQTAVANGEHDFIAIAIYSPDTKTLLPPCGACRQVITEFTKDCSVILVSDNEEKILKINELYPFDSLDFLKN